MLKVEDIEKYRAVDMGYNDWTSLTVNGTFAHINLINIRNINGNFDAVIFTNDGWRHVPREYHPYIVAAAFPKRITTFYLDEHGNER